VVILCGGLGTRLREETEFRPKPMVEIGGRPVLWHIMKGFAHHGFTEFVLCVGYKGQQIKNWFLNYEAERSSDFTVTLGHPAKLEIHQGHAEEGWRVTICDTGQETMTGGRVKRVAHHLGPGPFIVTYGDGLADIDVRKLVAFHQGHGHLATVTATRPLSRFGHVDLLDELDANAVLEREPLERLAARGEIVAYQHDGFWRPMDTYRDSLLLNELWATGIAPWKVWDR
jgi:glucose-1-phosphate cytidylyltransferase